MSQVKPIPDEYRGAMPYLIVVDAAGALDFYKEAFGAPELKRFAGPDGRVGHAEIRIGEAVVMLADEFPDEATFKDAIRTLWSYSLVETGDGTLSIHRLVQWAARGRLTSDEQAEFAKLWGSFSDGRKPSGNCLRRLGGPIDFHRLVRADSTLPT